MMYKNSFSRLAFLLILTIVFNTSFAQTGGTNKAAWMKTAKFGIFVHYLESLQNEERPWNMGKRTSWDSCVDDFNTDTFASEVNHLGAGYVIFTTQQGDKYFCMPNPTFEKTTGYARGDATSHRDLIADLYTSLQKYNIRLLLYVTGDGTYKDPKSSAVLKNPSLVLKQNNNNFIVTPTWVDNWAKVLQDMSLRYGTKVSGWWVDGTYRFHGYTDTLISVLHNALKAGNPNSIIGFNPSPQRHVVYYTKWDDYTAGEMYKTDLPQDPRMANKKQYHILLFLGSNWKQPDIRFTKDSLTNYVNNVNELGGVVTLDVALMRNGAIAPNQYKFLEQVSAGIKPREK